ncbi:MAG: hypothetical protein KME28_10755 [Pelatocladus maniniholoensis HA4357-MV3]|uniref:Uncharacterized protein n=1 Tax=Pelatocladus maniniholoensis HA4357-MV3 TaxID=1117104 RepID=A0A9E3H8K6_9NOST|nr:hypothetical protein [Pelatocladus maniniholoensis HA4357-MV3]
MTINTPLRLLPCATQGAEKQCVLTTLLEVGVLTNRIGCWLVVFLLTTVRPFARTLGEVAQSASTPLLTIPNQITAAAQYRDLTGLSQL